MKKYELSEEELGALIGLAAAITCDDEEFKENEALVMNAAASSLLRTILGGI